MAKLLERIEAVPWTPVDLRAAAKALKDGAGEPPVTPRDPLILRKANLSVLPSARDVAIGVKVMPSPAESDLKIVVRENGTGSTQRRVWAGRITNLTSAFLEVKDAQAGTRAPIFGLPPPGSGYTLELYAHGDDCGVLVNGKLVRTLNEATPRHAGRASIWGTDVVPESVEFKNLDQALGSRSP